MCETENNNINIIMATLNLARQTAYTQSFHFFSGYFSSSLFLFADKKYTIVLYLY